MQMVLSAVIYHFSCGESSKLDPNVKIITKSITYQNKLAPVIGRDKVAYNLRFNSFL